MLQARRERKLRPLALNDKPPDPGYFRPRPYETSDAKRYSRPDGALADALEWLEETKEPVLYLSGASGSGKSSLVSAGLAPILQEKHWSLLLVRSTGAPLTALIETLRGAHNLFAKPPSARAGVRTLLLRASNERERVDAEPLLIIMDQFEEFLILDEGPEKSEYAAFLRELAAEPIPKVVMLHVFRSDYRELIFREGLPEYVDRVSAFSLPAFTRKDAEAFLHNGPVRLDEIGCDQLFLGLDRIEESRGLYRPITLNMVGFVLERQGKALAADPGKLIETYLRDCLTQGGSKDFASPVVETLVTREGTKAPQSLEAIATRTMLESWQVKATLSDLSRQSLVRRIENRWEISHDFLARIIGQIVGRLKRPWLARKANPLLFFFWFRLVTCYGRGRTLIHPMARNTRPAKHPRHGICTRARF